MRYLTLFLLCASLAGCTSTWCHKDGVIDQAVFNEVRSACAEYGKEQARLLGYAENTPPWGVTAVMQSENCMQTKGYYKCEPSEVADSKEPVPKPLMEAVQRAAQNPGGETGPDMGGYLGVWVNPGTIGNPPTPVVFVPKVDPLGPAHKAGMLAGDIIVAVNGQPLPHANLPQIIRQYRPGTRLNLTILRVGRQQEMAVILGDKSARAVSPPVSSPTQTQPPPTPAPSPKGPAPGQTEPPSNQNQGIHTAPPSQNQGIHTAPPSQDRGAPPRHNQGIHTVPPGPGS